MKQAQLSIGAGDIVERARELFRELEYLDTAGKIEIINAIRQELHAHSPLAAEPVDCVLWISADEVSSNDYNPNAVAPPEMKLLEHSIREDGYTQPIVAWKNGANAGALYVQESGNVSGYRKIALPPGHTWKSFCNLLLESLPKPTREHYLGKFRGWLKGWRGRGYVDGIPDEAPRVLEQKQWAPSWRRLCKVLLRNDWWCKGLGLQQPKSQAYARYMELAREKRGLA